MQENKVTFRELCQQHNITMDIMSDLATIAGVPFSVMGQLYGDEPIARNDAENVLSAISATFGGEWTVQNVSVKLLEVNKTSFTEVWYSNHFRTELIAPLAEVSEELINHMVRNEPVPRVQADAVLRVLARVLRQTLTLQNVYVKLENLDEIARWTAECTKEQEECSKNWLSCSGCLTPMACYNNNKCHEGKQ